MKRTILHLALIGSAVLIGCSDPSDKVQKSATSDPKKSDPPAAAAGKEFTIRAASTVGFVGSKVTGSHNGGVKKFAGRRSRPGTKNGVSPPHKNKKKNPSAGQGRRARNMYRPRLFSAHP